jgi:hypothetical protein
MKVKTFKVCILNLLFGMIEEKLLLLMIVVDDVEFLMLGILSLYLSLIISSSISDPSSTGHLHGPARKT